jgi:hypothetical protein
LKFKSFDLNELTLISRWLHACSHGYDYTQSGSLSHPLSITNLLVKAFSFFGTTKLYVLGKCFVSRQMLSRCILDKRWHFLTGPLTTITLVFRQGQKVKQQPIKPFTRSGRFRDEKFVIYSTPVYFNRICFRVLLLLSLMHEPIRGSNLSHYGVVVAPAQFFSFLKNAPAQLVILKCHFMYMLLYVYLLHALGLGPH